MVLRSPAEGGRGVLERLLCRDGALPQDAWLVAREIQHRRRRAGQLAAVEDDLHPRATVIVLGDARSNNLDPRADILRRISERSKRLVWLNPEGRMAWGWGDSEMPRYAAFCSVVRQCATAKQLERAVSDIVAAYQ